MGTVMCFGTFDSLHPGHEDYFRQARELGDRVTVVVARDTTALEVKGQLPGMNQGDRCAAVADHPFVDEALLGYADDKYRIIEEIRPDVLLLGYDQQSFTDQLEAELEKRGIEAKIVRAQSFEPEKYHSSLLREAAEPVVEVEEESDAFLKF